MFKRAKKSEKKVPAQIQYLGELRDFITDVGRQYGVSERVINAFKLAIDEAGTNIIRHAYRDWEGFITVRMIIKEKSVTILLIDQGHTFDPTKVKDPDLRRYVDIGKKGGLGIFIIRRVIDKIDYFKTEEGNVLRLTKNRDLRRRQPFVIPEMGMSLRLRYSLAASILYSLVILILFFFDFRIQEFKIRNDNLNMGKALTRVVATQLPELLYEEKTPEIYALIKEVYQDHQPLVYDVLVVDTLGEIQSAIDPLLLFEQFDPHEPIRTFSDSIQVYPWGEDVVICDITEKVKLQGNGQQVGTVHLFLNKQVIDQKILRAQRYSILSHGFFLILGCAAVFGFVYLILNPFRRLTLWMRALGRGEVQDAFEFNATDEIGEIAHAFNEITDKFRKSQENLAEQERLQKEMQVAQDIQHTLLPDRFPEIEGYEIASYYEAAKEVGGDYFDFVEVDNDTLGIVVADVSGKGVPGSLVMTMIRTALRTEARGNKNAADVLARVNDFVINDMKRGMFVTVFYIILDSQNRTINYASAGHNPMILYRNKTKRSYYLNPRGFPIGINLPDRTLFRRSIQSDTLQLREDDVLIIYTDGITEAMNPKRERYGDERFLMTIRKFGMKKVKPLVQNIREEIMTFTEGFAQSDDITLVAIREKMRAEEVLLNLRLKLMELVDKKGLSVKNACLEVGVSTSTYYKYRKLYLKHGLDGLKEKVQRSEIEERHISIEDKAKIYDIIKQNPEFGPKRISEELTQDKYGNTIIEEKRIYEELVRSRLNTKELRMAFIERGGRGKRMKPPGTPFLSLDGQVIVDTGVKRPRYHIPPQVKSDSEFPIPEEQEAALPKTYDAIRSYSPDDSDTEEVEEISTEMEDAINLLDVQEIEESSEHVKPEGRGILSHSESDDKKKSQPDERQKEEYVEEESIEEGMQPFNDLVDQLLDVDEMSEEMDTYTSSDIQSIIEETETEADELSNDKSFVKGPVVDDLFEEEMRSKEISKSGGAAESQDEKSFEELFSMLSFEQVPVEEVNRTKKATVQDMHCQRYLESGQWFYRQELYAKAIEEFNKAIETNGKYAAAYQCLGDAYFRLGQLEKAKQTYEKVHHLDPENMDVMENLGVIFANRGDYKRAVWQWGEVLKRNPHRHDIVSRIKRMQKVIRQRTIQ
jgi:serine phosphatase RsbU (regulator of sigma subunit)/anti-sigma regulatory factor (Ser/Thr protein kinase)/tetratricopeptide (TPR) repeat protein/transposase